MRHQQDKGVDQSLNKRFPPSLSLSLSSDDQIFFCFVLGDFLLIDSWFWALSFWLSEQVQVALKRLGNADEIWQGVKFIVGCE